MRRDLRLATFMVDADARRRRLALLLREQQGRRHLSEFIDEMAKRLGRPPETLRLADLPKTDAIHSSYLSAASRCRQRVLSGSKCWSLETPSEQETAGALSEIRLSLPNSIIYLWRRLSEYCGAVESTTEEAVDRAFELLELDGDGLIAVAPDGTYGVALDLSSQPDSTEPVFELLAWMSQRF